MMNLTERQEVQLKRVLQDMDKQRHTIVVEHEIETPSINADLKVSLTFMIEDVEKLAQFIKEECTVEQIFKGKTDEEVMSNIEFWVGVRGEEHSLVSAGLQWVEKELW